MGMECAFMSSVVLMLAELDGEVRSWFAHCHLRPESTRHDIRVIAA